MKVLKSCSMAASSSAWVLVVESMAKLGISNSGISGDCIDDGDVGVGMSEEKLGNVPSSGRLPSKLETDGVAVPVLDMPFIEKLGCDLSGSDRGYGQLVPSLGKRRFEPDSPTTSPEISKAVCLHPGNGGSMPSCNDM